MTRSPYIAGLLFFITLVLGQILLFRNLVLFGLAFNFAYIGFLLLLPINIKPYQLLTLAFFTGLLCDTFYDTAGMHAAASVAMAFARPTILKLLAPAGGYDDDAELTPHIMNSLWLSYYFIFMAIIHHTVLFIIDTIGMELSFGFFGKIVLSSIMTTATLIIVLHLFKIRPRK